VHAPGAIRIIASHPQNPLVLDVDEARQAIANKGQ
jgi:hypothetical protein